MSAQQSVSFLHAPDQPVRIKASTEAPETAPEAFTFSRNLIFFEALVDGSPGNFILDTGAPTLVVNNRGASDSGANYTGYGSGGTVSLSDYRVDNFSMSGRTVENYWAIGLDLRSLEHRTGRVIDGMVGYDLINDGELRIDYGQRSFRLLPSTRRPLHAGAAPRAVIRFTLVDHLPVIRVRIDGKRYDFAIDTGAGINLLANDLLEELPVSATTDEMNVQGLDGRPVDGALYELRIPELGGDEQESVRFAAMDLKHLQESGQKLAGILGSAFLSRYTAGIDYRRRKIYLW